MRACSNWPNSKRSSRCLKGGSFVCSGLTRLVDKCASLTAVISFCSRPSWRWPIRPWRLLEQCWRPMLLCCCCRCCCQTCLCLCSVRFVARPCRPWRASHGTARRACSRDTASEAAPTNPNRRVAASCSEPTKQQDTALTRSAPAVKFLTFDSRIVAATAAAGLRGLRLTSCSRSRARRTGLC